ncbi:TetR/AcrR family transcriptional regulator [Glycomyces sp. NPDC046736]|uniref:TetR/AcrR family transcriptional regulator n=1 Tax=Glycomyces sp. NPDC046736 TaxID=3155615 RepID=UPI0033C156D5
MTSNTAGGPTRRERMRAETIAEIKASARAQLEESGPSGVSLRAIARDVGVTPAALYRYFDSLDALLTELCCDFYDELIAVTRDSMDASPPEAHLERMKAWVWCFRSWAVANRRRFELMLSFPEGDGALTLDGRKLEDGFEALDPVTRRSLEHSHLCGRELAAFWRQTEAEGGTAPGGPPMPEVSEALAEELQDKCSRFIVGEQVPLPWIYSFVSAWVRVFGLVVMEAFGSLPVQENVDEFYKTQVMTMLRDFGISE